MSLIYWWPFTDNTVDKINSKTFTSTNWSFQSNGKIGNCFAPSWTDSNTISRQIYADNVSIPETFSVAVWVKNNNNFNSPRTYCPIQFSNGDCWISGANNKGWDFSHNSLRLIFNNGSNVSGSAGNAEVNWGYNPKEFLGSWYHIAFTVNKTTRKAELFINGVSKGIKDLPSAVDTYGGTFKLKINWVQGWMLDGSLNDLRIYDHALSQAEVKELSKALVVHYSFNDVLAEPTTNVSTVSGWSTYSAYWTISERTETGLKLYRHTGSTSDCVAIQNSAVTSKMAQGDIWTFSCYLYKNGQPYKSTASGISSEGYGYKTVSWESHDDGYYRITFQIISSPGTWVLHNYFFSPIDIGVNCEMRYMQFEKKDHATPYTPSSRDSMIIDESGYNHPTILVNDCSFTTDTNSGTLSLHTAGTTSSTAHDSCSYLKSDIGTLITPTEFTVCFNAKVKQFGVQSSGILSFNIASSEPTEYTDSTFVQYDGNFRLNKAGDNTQSNISSSIVTLNEWHNYAFVWDGANLIGYKDGIQYGTPQSASFTVDPFRYIYLGYDRAGSVGRNADVTWGDFRFYTTALTSSDIKDLYQTKAYISNKGDMMCGEFIEDKTDTMVTEKGTFECKEVYEEIDSAYERLEYIQTSGTQYIKTGIQSHDNITKLNAHYYQLTYNPGQILFGCYDGVATMYFNYKESGSIEHRSHWMYTDLRTGAEWKENQDVKSTLVINGNNLTLTNNGKTVTGVASRSKGSNSYEMLLCAYSSQGSPGYCFYCRLYNFQIEVDNVLVRNFIPCKRKNDNVVGLYDSVNKIFYTNAGSGTFGAGPSVTNNDASIYEDGRISGREIIEI